MQEFNSEAIKLEGSNLIEASAGTGKTYSIAILLLRLLLEKRILIQQILLVTFTKAAAAELKERAALFIRIAIQEADCENENEARDQKIWRIVQKSSTESSTSSVKECLNQALLDLDKAAMQTIHSFCQAILTEYAFETKQAFGCPLQNENDELINRFIDAYWRQSIAPLDVAVHKILYSNCRELIGKATQCVLSNQKFHGEPANFEAIERLTEIENEISNYFQNKKETYIIRIKNTVLKNFGDSNKNKLIKLISTETNLFLLFNKETKFKITEIFAEEIAKCKNWKQEIESIKKGINHKIIDEGSQFVARKTKEYLIEKNFLTYDALIENLHAVKDELPLKKLMQTKYKAVFIDEFQDTDKLQYEIFESFFQHSGGFLCYIGDPKQSIYAFRKADLNTYFKAKKQVEHLWTMNVNYRSTGPYIEAMNHFFKEDATLKTFHYEHDEIQYHAVQSSEKNTHLKGITSETQPVQAPLQIITNNTPKDKRLANVCNLVVTLLSGGYKLNNKPIIPSDFGILVRSNYEGKDIKALLEKKGIPAVVIDDSSIFSSNEAKDLSFLLNAVLVPNKSNIDTFLLTNLVGYTIETLPLIDHDTVLNIFRNYLRIWKENGIYAMLHKFLTDFSIETKWTSDEKIGHRVLSNTYQIIELLQDVSTKQNYTPTKTYAFLIRAIQNLEKNKDAFAKRIERDEAAVKIATIHKSKGLEYNIVVLPSLDFNKEIRDGINSFKMEQNDRIDYLFSISPLPEAHNNLLLEQNEQENRRLQYVALTRARYSSFVFVDTDSKNSTIKLFIHKLNKQISDYEGFIKITPVEEMELQEIIYTNNYTKNTLLPKNFPSNTPFDANWHKMSYSFLAAAHRSFFKESSMNYPNNYDHFIFHLLDKGMHVGNMLHNLFEYLDFTSDKEWEQVIAISLQKFTPTQKENYAPWMLPFIKQVLNANINVDNRTVFQLKDICNEFKINELEFDFKLPNDFNSKALETLFGPNDIEQIHTNFGEVKGMMTGLVDLFFEHNGCFYILDWKSNYLGDTIEQYEGSFLNEAMNESNYHLQYCIYSVAMKRFLESKLGEKFQYEQHFGGVIYLFLRGLRENKASGVYTTKLSLEKVEQLEQLLNIPEK